MTPEYYQVGPHLWLVRDASISSQYLGSGSTKTAALADMSRVKALYHLTPTKEPTP